MFSAKQFIGMVGVVGLSATGALAQASWESFGNFTEGAAYDLHVHNGELYLAGRNGDLGTGLGAFIRRWDGTQWVWVGNQLLVERPGAIARDLTTHNGELYVVGEFDDGVFRQAARWDGSAWQPVGDGLMRGGRKVESFDGRLWAIAVASPFSQSRLKVLQGSQWVDPPSGPLVGANWIGIVDDTLHVGMMSGELLRYQQGAFVSLGVVDAGLRVGPVVRFDGRLYAGLSNAVSPFPQPAFAVTLATQIGDDWKRVSGVLTATDFSFVTSMREYNGELFQFGQQISTFPLGLPGEPPGGALARWCPGQRGVPNSPFGAIWSSIVWQGQLIIGANSEEWAGFGTVYALTPRQNPVIANTLTDVGLACDGAARTIEIETPAPAATWLFRENLATGLVDFPLPAQVVGTRWIIPVPATQNGQFRYIVTNSLGSSETNVVGIRGIDIDFNNNGVFPEDQDVIDFLNVLAGGTCVGTSIRPCDSIDVNVNGIYPEDADVVAFFTNLAGGCE